MQKNEIVQRIEELKQSHDAIILAHNYQIPPVQDVADFLGDSLDLAMRATQTDAKYIIFCGVDFMAQSSQILNPDKTVIHPDIKAECPMAAMVDAKNLAAFKKKYPKAKVVAYINTSAEVKALSDICCTSSNGAKVVHSLSEKEIIFVPDRNLGMYIQRFITDKTMILWPGYCSTHDNITTADIQDIKNQHPQAEILVHPECSPDVIDLADHAFSTNGMVNYAKKSETQEFIIGTEKDMCYRLKNENPHKFFYPIPSAICTNMKKITLEKVLKSLETLQPKLTISQEIMTKAKKPLQRMMEVGRGD
jgi:quinolinate synthase